MEAFLVSITTISVAEIGDRTQLLSLLLAARYRRPWPIIAGILCATLANHALAGILGVWFGSLLKPRTLEVIVGISMIAMAIWTLKPDKLDENAGAAGARVALCVLSPISAMKNVVSVARNAPMAPAAPAFSSSLSGFKVQIAIAIMLMPTTTSSVRGLSKLPNQTPRMPASAWLA